MKILHVFDYASPRRGGGTVKLILPLMQELKNRGHEVSLCTTDYEWELRDISALMGVKVYPYYNSVTVANFIITPSMLSDTKNNLKHYDIIHLHCFRSFQNVVVYNYAKKYGIPYIIDSHGSMPRMGNIFKKALKRGYDSIFGFKMLKHASMMVAETQLGINEYQQFGIEHERIELITPPLPLQEFATLPPKGLFRKKFGLENKEIIMFMGRINWIKGLKFLVESFYDLARVRDDVVLVIVGDDDGYKKSLLKLVKKMRIDNIVLFPGYYSGVDKLSALQDANVVAQTSVYEQGAWMPLEAILCNTPVIVSNNSGAGEDIKRMQAGYLCDYGDRIQLRDTFIEVLDHKKEAEIVTAKAKEFILANMSLQNNVKQYEELYQKCLAQRGL